MNIINPKKLFRKEILEYQVETKKLKKVSYVNLDNAATTSPFIDVEKGVMDYMISYGSVHRGAGAKSEKSTDIYEDSRNTICKFVGAPNDSYVVFTGNTTGAMNSISHFFSFLDGKVAVSDIEHSSSWLPWVKNEGIKSLGVNQGAISEMESVNKKIQEEGCKQIVKYSVNDKFEFDLEDIRKIFIKNKIKAFVLTASSNVTGYCPPIKEIGKIVHENGAYFIVDGCQYIQHHEINMEEMGIDFLVASGHKFYAPYGGGFLIGPKDFFDQFISYEIGGGNLPYITKNGEFLRYHNQIAHDPGTPNAIGAVSMAVALNKIKEIGIKNIEEYEKGLTKKVYEEMKKNPKIDIYVNEKHLNTVIPFNIKGMTNKEVAERLNKEYGIGVRAGSFCVYNVVRKLLKIKDETQIIKDVQNGKENAVPGFVRASFGLQNTEEDAERFIKAINKIAL